MGGPDLRAHVTPDQLSESERRLYELARTGTPLAEIGVRLGLPVSEVDRRVELLVMRLGLPDRLALREPLRDPVMVANSETDALDPAPEPEPSGAPRAFCRRSVLIGGATAGLAAIGAGSAFLLARGGDDQAPTQPDSTATPEPTASATVIPGGGLDLIEPVKDAFERRTFAPGEEIDWPHGIFFMSVDTGEVEGWRLAPPFGGAAGMGQYDLLGSRFIQALSQDLEWRVLADRTDGRMWRYPALGLRLAAAADSRLIFEEIQPGGGLPGSPTGRYHLTSPTMAGDASFELPPTRFGPDPLVHPGGTFAAVASGKTDVAINIVNLSDGTVATSHSIPGQPDYILSVRWNESLRSSNDFAFDVAELPSNGSSAAAIPPVRQYRLSWTAGSLSEPTNFPRGVLYSPAGDHLLVESAMRVIPAQDLGGGELWPAVEVLGNDGQPRAYIRSAALHFGDILPGGRWLADGSGFFALAGSHATEGHGKERVQHILFRVSRLGGVEDPVVFELPPPPGSAWFYDTQYRAALPHPTNADLLAIGRLEVYNRPLGSVIQANLKSE
ncbi:MAG: hypothetical protein ACRDHF_05340, partial [Tepidiformaceae bacterium]